MRKAGYILIPLVFIGVVLIGQKTVFVSDARGIAFAYITTPAATTTTNAGQYYYFASTFTNETAINFGVVSDTLTYTGMKGMAQVMFTASLTTDTNNTEVTVGIKKNGVIEANSEMTVEISSTTDIMPIVVWDLIALNPGDNLSIWIKSDKAGAVITPVKGTTSAVIH